jgi:hypothetical protein
MDISQIQQQISEASTGDNLPPVDAWNPDFCGDMNLVIKRSGQWWHEGTPFTRAKLIKLLSSVLKKEDDKYFLVTPVEKIGIQVEDVPFVIIDVTHSEKGINVITQTGDTVLVGKDHPIEIRQFEDGDVPYCNIRRNLWARVHQNVLYRWVDEASVKTNGSQTELYLQSGDYSFCIGRYAE